MHKNIIRPIIIFSILLSLSGCNMVILNPDGLIALEEKHLLLTVLGLMLIVVIPVIILVLAIPFKFRATNPNSKYMPHWEHSTVLEIIWWGFR